MRKFIAALALALVACSPAPSSPASSPTAMPVESGPQSAQAPGEVLAAINAAVPGFAPGNAVSDNSTGAQGFRVTGAANGQTYNVQLMHMNEGWQVVSIRRDIAWADAPKVVRDAAAAAPAAIRPTRVVENREPGADGVIYELYTEAAAPIMEIRFADGQAAVMPPAH